MVVPEQKRGILLLFPPRESPTPRPKNESCPECERLEAAYQAAINEIRAVVRGRFASVREKLARLVESQNKRDRALAQLYSHTRELHRRNTA